jgi:hypothetical protein
VFAGIDIQAALRGPGAKLFRRQLGEWIVRLVPVGTLVPERHAPWRPVVRDAMAFVVERLSAARLAPKILEQIRMPAETPPGQGVKQAPTGAGEGESR